MTYVHTIHFSVDEAKKTLREIEADIEEMIRLKKRIDEKGYDIFAHKYFGGQGPNGMGAFPAELEKLVDIVKKVSLLGVLVRSMDSGLIDFPHKRQDEEEVYLCWRYPEPDIEYWHTIGEGFKGRKSLSEL